MKKLILFELRKVFSKRLALIALIGIILFSALLSFSTFQNKYAFDGVSAEGSGKTAVEIDKEIAAKYEGILTDEKVQQMMNDFAPTHDLHGLNAMYLYQNATQSAAFSRFSDKEGNWNGLSVSDVFGNEKIKIGYVDGWLSTSKNMVRVFIVLALAVIIMLAPIFSGEYEGVDNIILTSKYGKTKCATAKVAAGILTAILTTALVAAFNLLLALIFYGTEGLDCSILFAPSDYVEAFIAGKRITAKLIAEALRTLPEEKRKAVLLYYFAGMTDTEIGRLFDTPRSTIQYRRTSSFDLLKKYLEEHADEWDEW